MKRHFGVGGPTEDQVMPFLWAVPHQKHLSELAPYCGGLVYSFQ